MTIFNKLAAAGFLAVAGLIAAPHASAACATIKHFNKPVRASILGFGYGLGNITFTTASCWTPSTNKASPQRFGLNNANWFFVDSAGGNLWSSPGSRINQGAFTNPNGSAATSWGTVRYTIRNASSLPPVLSSLVGQPIDIRVEAVTFGDGFCTDFVNGVLVTETSCRANL
jgi:hypothetical protein